MKTLVAPESTEFFGKRLCISSGHDQFFSKKNRRNERTINQHTSDQHFKIHVIERPDKHFSSENPPD